MISLRRPRPVHAVAETGALTTLLSTGSFTLETGHPLRRSDCLLCGMLIGGESAAVIGVSPLVGPPCNCGRVHGDVFLIHDSHVPVKPSRLAVAINQAIRCPVPHPTY